VCFRRSPQGLLTKQREEVPIRQELAYFVLLVFCAATPVLAQQEQQITVKGGEVSNGVVIVTAQEGKTFIDLRCNKDFAYCKIPQPGTYVMVRLPKNWGLYDCADVRVYRKMADLGARELVGEYCLVEEK
jgi:hypothetical protein